MTSHCQTTDQLAQRLFLSSSTEHKLIFDRRDERPAPSAETLTDSCTSQSQRQRSESKAINDKPAQNEISKVKPQNSVLQYEIIYQGYYYELKLAEKEERSSRNKIEISDNK